MKIKIDPKKNNKTPIISIITVVFNNFELIEKTIQSVINQTYKNIQYIVIDGGSTDGTLDIIKKYKKYIDILIIEKDTGIYDAMNKGIKLAKGNWINFMNSGDTFYSTNTLNDISFNDYASNSFIYGKAKIFDSNAKFIKILKPLKANKLNLTLFASRVACHQAVFYNTNIKFMYPSQYKFLGDLFSYFEFIKVKPARKLDQIVCNYSLGGTSQINRNLVEKELWNILREKSGFFRFLYLPTFIYSRLRMKMISK